MSENNRSVRLSGIAAYGAELSDPVVRQVAADTGIAAGIVALATCVAGKAGEVRKSKRELACLQNSIVLSIIETFEDSREKVEALFSHDSVSGWSPRTALVMHDTARRLLTKWGMTLDALWTATVTGDEKGKVTSFSTLERKFKAGEPAGSDDSDNSDDAGGTEPAAVTGSTSELLDMMDRILTVLTDRDMTDDELNRLAVASERARRLAVCEL